MTKTSAKSSNASGSLMRTPRYVDIDITSRCNLRCRYCYFFNNAYVDYYDLPTNQWLQFFDELGRCGVMGVSLQGGEPFTRKDLPELIEGIVSNRMRFSILTNGTLIDDESAAFISSTGRCDQIQVSIDGSGPETHDTCRGQGSFSKAIHGLKTIRRYKIPVTVRMTIHRYNVHDLENTARLLLEELDLPAFTTNSAGFIGTCRQNADDVMLGINERQTAMLILEKLSNKYNGRISATAGPLSEARMWQQMESAQKNGSPGFDNGGRLTACGCTSNKIAVRADGFFVPCCMLPQMKLGKINQDRLEELWINSPILNQFRRRHNIPLSTFEYCEDCHYIPYCTGNCPGMAYNSIERVDHPSPDACLRSFFEKGGKLLDTRNLNKRVHNLPNQIPTE